MSTASAKPRAAGAHSVESSVGETHERFPQIESILSAPQVTQTFGVVEGRDGSAWVVRAGDDVLRARRAKGCLIEPQGGDTVLVARSEHHGSFVLSVLVGQTEDSDSVVAVEGNLTLRAKAGKVDIVGGEGVNVTSGGEVAVNAPSVVARTMSATVFSDTLSYVGRKLDAQVDRARVVGQVLETAIDRVTSRVKQSFRTIDEIERVKVKQLHVNAEDTLNMHGKNTLMTAEKIVKLDGEQIVIG
jgi:hypothetical protein